MRRACWVVAVLLGCGDDGGGAGTGTEFSETIEFPFDQPLGPQRANVWTRPGSISSFAMSTNDDYFTASDTGFQKFTFGVVEPLWTTGVTRAGIVVPTTDGGLVFRNSQYVGAAAEAIIGRITGDGTLAFERSYPNSLSGSHIVLPSGNIAFHLQALAEGGSVDDNAYVVMLDPAGNEVWKTLLPRVHVPEHDSPGTGSSTRSPGMGYPGAPAMAVTDDGGLFLVGQYEFVRTIQCGTNEDPRDPEDLACGSDAMNGMIMRLSATGDVMWTKRLGAVYAAPNTSLRAAVALSDGGVLAIGHREMVKFYERPLYIQGLAVRYSASGELQWSHSYPWGLAPGVTNGPSFIDGTPGDGATADVLMGAPPGNPCRMIRFEADGSISRVQILEGGNVEIGAACDRVASPTQDFYYQPAPSDPVNGPIVVVKLAPPP